MSGAAAESTFPCAVVPGREAAERAVARLAAAGIDALVVEPGPRYHLLPAGSLEVRVPASEATRARVLLAAEA